MDNLDNLSKYELEQLPENRGIKKCKNISRVKNCSMGLNWIVKITNLSHNELEQITKMNDLTRNKLEQIAKMRYIKNIVGRWKEELLIVLSKSEQSHTEVYKSKSNNTEIEDTRKV